MEWDGHSWDVESVCFLSDESTLSLGSADKTVRL